MDFDSSNDYVDFGTNLLENTPNNGTITMWVYFKNLDNTYDMLFSKREDKNNRFFLQRQRSEYPYDGGDKGNKLRWGINRDGASYTETFSDNSMTEDTWYHISVYWGSQGMGMYVNGIKQTINNDTFTGTPNFTNGSSHALIGQTTTSDFSHAANFKVSEFAIYGTVLNESEINNIILNGPVPVPEPLNIFLLLSGLLFAVVYKSFQ